MHAEAGVRALDGALGDYVLGAHRQLLGGLEQHLYAAAQLVLDGVEQLRRAEQHGRVRVVAAGVHEALPLAGELHAALLLDAQRVYVRAQEDALAGLAAHDVAHEPARLEAAVGYAHLVKLLGYAVGGAELLKARLRIPVKIPAHLNDVRKHFVRKRFYISHDVISFSCF